MRKPTSTLAVVVMLLTTAASFAGAQYAPGDVVVADQYKLGQDWPLWGVTPQGQVYTVTSSLPFFGWSVAPAADNRTVWVSGVGQLGAANARIAPDGTVTNFNLQKVFGGIDVDGGGNVILSTRGDKQIMKYDGNAFTTLYSGPPLMDINGAGIDLASGDLVVFDGRANAILRATLAGPRAVTTVVSNVLPAFVGAGLHDDPETGTMVGAWAPGGRLGPLYSAVFRLTPGSPGVLSTLLLGASVGVPSSLDRDPRDGQYVIASVSSPEAVLRYDARNNAVTTIAVLAGRRPHAAAVAGSRHLCALGEAKPGQNYSLLVSSPNEPGAYYVVALSLGFRPGLPVTANRKIYLQPDSLFFFSLTNSGIFSGFQGGLDLKGEAVATLSIPAIPTLQGVRFFAAAITFASNRVSVISDTLGVTIR